MTMMILGGYRCETDVEWCWWRRMFEYSLWMTVSDWRWWTRTMERRDGWEMELWVLLLYKERWWWRIRWWRSYRGRGRDTMRVVMGVVMWGVIGFFFMFGWGMMMMFWMMDGFGRRRRELGWDSTGCCWIAICKKRLAFSGWRWRKETDSQVWIVWIVIWRRRSRYRWWMVWWTQARDIERQWSDSSIGLTVMTMMTRRTFLLLNKIN